MVPIQGMVFSGTTAVLERSPLYDAARRIWLFLLPGPLPCHQTSSLFVYVRDRCDNDSFLNSNRVPIDKMIALLKQYFSPDTPGDDAYSLAISAGEGGARLTHSHARQYNFALQVNIRHVKRGVLSMIAFSSSMAAVVRYDEDECWR